MPVINPKEQRTAVKAAGWKILTGNRAESPKGTILSISDAYVYLKRKEKAADYGMDYEEL